MDMYHIVILAVLVVITCVTFRLYVRTIDQETEILSLKAVLSVKERMLDTLYEARTRAKEAVDRQKSLNESRNTGKVLTLGGKPILRPVDDRRGDSYNYTTPAITGASACNGGPSYSSFSSDSSSSYSSFSSDSSSSSCDSGSSSSSCD